MSTRGASQVEPGNLPRTAPAGAAADTESPTPASPLRSTMPIELFDRLHPDAEDVERDAIAFGRA